MLVNKQLTNRGNHTNFKGVKPQSSPFWGENVGKNYRFGISVILIKSRRIMKIRIFKLLPLLFFSIILISCGFNRYDENLPTQQPNVENRNYTQQSPIQDFTQEDNLYVQRNNTEDNCIIGKYIASGWGRFYSQFIDNHNELHENWPDPYSPKIVWDNGYAPDMEFTEDGFVYLIAKENENISGDVQIVDLNTDEVAVNIDFSMAGEETGNYIIEDGKLVIFNRVNNMQYTVIVDGQRYTDNYDAFEYISDSGYECTKSVLMLNTSVDSENYFIKNNAFVYFQLWRQ